MGVLALDVVLIPDAELLSAAITLNRALQGVPDAPIVLDQATCLPHVSLAMGCVREEEISAIANVLDALAAAHPPIELAPTGFHVRQSRTGYLVASMELARTAPLQALHETVMRGVDPLLSRDAAPEMFVAPESISSSTIQWVNAYDSAASFDRFWPHITLGMGALPDDAIPPAPGLASRLALCQLGPHCTCRRVLVEAALRSG
ncbi:MAG TPA: 2'-5' RNA ligase family protein [Nitrospiria bacterium]|nr:2'-5' RNA ligase family protein [Nitrospiria bacterium]